MKFRFASAVFLVGLAGCAATPSTVFVTPEGRITRCAAHGSGLQGMASAASIHETCVGDMKAVGALPLAEAGGVGLVISSEPSALRVLKTIEGSPAERGGIRAGDVLTAVDGGAVYSQPDARQLVFGRVNTPVRITFNSNDAERTVTLIRVPIQSVLPTAGK